MQFAKHVSLTNNFISFITAMIIAHLTSFHQLFVTFTMRFKANLLTLPFFRNWNFLAYSMDCSNDLYHLIKGW